MIYHNVPPREVHTQSLSIPSENSSDVLPLRTGHDSSQIREIRIKKHLHGPPGPRSSKVGPSMGSTTALGTLRVRDGPASGQYLGARAPRASQPTIESQPGTIHGFFLKKGREPSGPVERTRELYGLTAEKLKSVTKLTLDGSP